AGYDYRRVPKTGPHWGGQSAGGRGSGRFVTHPARAKPRRPWRFPLEENDPGASVEGSRGVSGGQRLKEILDSKFLLTHYGAKDEDVLSRTRTKLAALRKERRGVLPSIVIAEVANAICQEAGRAEALAKLRALEHAGL